MNFKNKIKNLDIFIFIDDINKLTSLNVLKFQKINLIYTDKNYTDKKFQLITQFCLKKKINLFVINEYKVAIKFKLSGIVITHNRKGIIYMGNPLSKKINIKILGKVHSQNDFFIKQKQGCGGVFLSPIFNTQKYSKNNILKIPKFNLISNHWDTKIFALGGINFSNVNKLKNTRVCGFGFQSFLDKKKARLLLSKRAFL
jgi:thiamine monophosphate synthase